VNRARERALRVAAALGVDRRCARASFDARASGLAAAAVELDGLLGAGGVALVTGPSGAGKTTLLRMLACPAVRVRPLRRAQRGAVVVGLCAGVPVRAWLGVLSRFGLAEARVLLSKAGHLSGGETARLELALAAAACERRPGVPRTLVVDEWCATLDAETAAAVAHGAARWARARGVRLIGATPRCDLGQAAAPDVVVRINERGGVEWATGGLSRAC